MDKEFYRKERTFDTLPVGTMISYDKGGESQATGTFQKKDGDVIVLLNQQGEEVRIPEQEIRTWTALGSGQF